MGIELRVTITLLKLCDVMRYVHMGLDDYLKKNYTPNGIWSIGQSLGHIELSCQYFAGYNPLYNAKVECIVTGPQRAFAAFQLYDNGQCKLLKNETKPS